MNFANKVAMITGGSKGIGKEVAMRLASEGAKIAIVDLDEAALNITKQEMEKKEFKVITIVANVTVKEEIEKAIESIVAQFGTIDILINNAGVIRDNMLFKMSDDDWDIVMNVHLKGAFYTSRAVQKYMIENRYGRIINISSTSALGNRGQANYATAKAGLQGFTKTLAIELGKFGVTTNSVAPGFIETDMTKATAARVGVSFEDFIQEMVKAIPVSRSGKPSDIANAVAFFADERSSFVNGQILYVAGGPTN